MLIDVMISVVLAAMIGGAITYIVLSKKRGETCVGCPYAKECAKRKGGGCSGDNPAAHPTDAPQDENHRSGSDQPK